MSVVRTLIGNVKGPKGDTGSQGPQGVAGTIEIGSVQTVSYGSPASVTNSGTEEEAILDFQIPQGAPGAQVTDMSNLVLGAITDSTASYPAFAVNETGSTIFGKIRKFLSDLYNNTIKSGQVTTSTNVDEAGYVADARSIKSLNDSLANYVPYYVREVVINKSYTIGAHSSLNIGSDFDEVKPLSGYTFLQILGGKGNGDVGLVVSAGSGWVFNASNLSKTYTSITIIALYRKNI